MENENPNNFGLGVIGPKPFSPLDFHLAPMVTAPETINWTEGSGTPKPPAHDQNSSGSCTQHMLGYMVYILTGVELSRRDGYSRTHQPGGGAYMWQPFDNIKKSGQYTFDQGFPDPEHQTERNMSEIIVTTVDRRKWRVTYWRLTDTSIEGIARAIKKYKCVGAAFNVQWYTWADYENPEVPDPNRGIDGSHALCLYDYGFANYAPYIRAQPSWGGVAKHDFKSNYFQGGQSFDHYVMEIEEYTMEDESNGFIELINNKGKIGVIQYIDTPENLAYQGKLHKFAVPVERDDAGNPVVEDGHIKVKWNEMNIKSVDF